jgi:TRAP-type mannitol/chloroaromatic compound transport system substrate-binding protein
MDPARQEFSCIGASRDRREPEATTQGEDLVTRRTFIGRWSAAAVATTGAGLLYAPAVIAQPKIRWRMPTTWPVSVDYLQGAAQRFARLVDEMSAGRLTIEVVPAGQIMPPLAVFDACSQGTVDAFMGAAYYWDKKDPAAQWFCTVPFGMSPLGMQAWYFAGDGLKLWEETYAPFGLVPRPACHSGPQMAGWYRKKINTVADFKGLKIRMPALGGQVLAKLGATVVPMPASEVFSALERGVIDATEWVGPYDDLKLGLPNTARYYYFPGWHEPGTTAEFTFNKKAYDALPIDLRRIIDHAAAATWAYTLPEWEAKNAIALEKLKVDYKGKVEILALPMPVLKDLKKVSADVVRQESEKSPMARRVYASFNKFQAQLAPWRQLSEGAYQRLAES